MTVVYLDSVFLFNALLDYLLFLSTARLAGIPLRRRRYLLSGVLGGLYAAAVFLPGGGFLTETLVKAGVGLLLALIAFGRETHFLRLTLLTVAIACALAGTVLALGLLAGQHIPNARGIFYTNVNGKTLLLSASGVYLLLTVIFRAAAAHGIRGECLPVTVCLLGQTVALTALLDTGNSLRDTAGEPVLTAELSRFPQLAAAIQHRPPADPAYAAPALSKAASPAFADADGGGRRAAGQREQRLDGDWRRSLSKFADRPDGYGVGGRIYRFMGRGREKES